MTFLDGGSQESGKGFRCTFETKSRFPARHATAATHAEPFEDDFGGADAARTSQAPAERVRADLARRLRRTPAIERFFAANPFATKTL
jgi:hypothetical protein